jgi:hypothetical protein
MMCITVVINLVVGEMDKKGRTDLGDQIDHHCRRIFPALYFGLVIVTLGITFIFF